MSISAVAFAQKAVELAMLRPPIPYVLGGRTRAGTDCSNLIRLMLREMGGKDIQAGSNSMWASHVINRAFIHAGGTNKGGGHLVPGALLFMDYASPVNQTAAGTPGSMDHVGIYVGPVPGLLTPDGKQADVVHASSSRGMVCGSTLKNAWTHVAWLKGVDYDTPSLPSTSADLPAQAEPGQYAVVTEDTYLYPAIPGPGEAMVTKDGVRMRKQPKIVDGTNHNRICTVPNGTIMPILEQHKDWTRLEYGIHKAWIRNDMLAFG